MDGGLCAFGQPERLGAAGLGQLFVGALTYLMPVVIGGGPSAVRVGVGVLEAGAPIREAARNVAAVFALAVASLGGVPAERLTTAAWVVLLATYVVDIVLMARCGVAQARRPIPHHYARRPPWLT